MNERIKELYDQASIRYSVYEILKPRDERKSIPDIFAELIVKECMAVAAKQRKPANLNYNPGERFAEDLRQHFGVES